MRSAIRVTDKPSARIIKNELRHPPEDDIGCLIRAPLASIFKEQGKYSNPLANAAFLESVEHDQSVSADAVLETHKSEEVQGNLILSRREENL